MLNDGTKPAEEHAIDMTPNIMMYIYDFENN